MEPDEQFAYMLKKTIQTCAKFPIVIISILAIAFIVEGLKYYTNDPDICVKYPYLSISIFGGFFILLILIKNFRAIRVIIGIIALLISALIILYH